MSGIRHGINADVYWPQVGQVHVTELVVRKLLPLAADGLRMWEVDESEIGRLLDIIEHRCLRAANGSTWQVAEVARRERAGESRQDAVRGMLASYMTLMHSNEPVHTWESALNVRDDSVPVRSGSPRTDRAAYSIVACQKPSRSLSLAIRRDLRDGRP